MSTSPESAYSAWGSFAAARAEDIFSGRDLSYDQLCTQLFSVLRRHVDSEASVADIGCGVGGLTLMLHAAGYQTVGVDPDHESVTEARRRFNLNCVVGSAPEAIQARDGIPFDAAIANMVLHCVEEPAPLLKQISDIIQPEGTLLVTIPDEIWRANHASDLINVSNLDDGQFTRYEVVRPFRTADTNYGTPVTYYLYDSPAAYLHYAAPYFQPVACETIATPLNMRAYELGEVERKS